MAKNKKSTSNKRKKGFLVFFKKYLYIENILVFGVVLIVILSISVAVQRDKYDKNLPPPPAGALYRQSTQPIDARVKDLLSYMTLDEKIGQMALVDKNSLVKVDDINKYHLGAILSGAGAKPKMNTAQGWAEMIDEMQNQAKNSRLGIPILYGVDANHGHANVLGATVFPHAIGLGASADPRLVKDVAIASGQELSATGVNWSYSPSLDAPTDIRWGRVYEAFSSDPILNSQLGSAYIEGTQDNNGGAYVMATAKHYLGNGSMIWGQSNNKKFKIDQGKTPADESMLNSEYLPPYKSAVNSGVSSVMIGLNQWGDQRTIDSKYLITDRLKDQMGFRGFVVSDWYGAYEYSKTSNYNANIRTINAGLDMAMLPFDYKTFIKEVSVAVKKGQIHQSRIDDAVSRILYEKFKAGLFDTDQTKHNFQNFGSEDHKKLAREAVASSAVLLKNNDNLLPLSKNTGKIIVAGSGADNVGRQSGAWTVEWQGVDGNWMPGTTSILQGIRQVVGNKSSVEYEKNGNFSPNSPKANVGIVVVSEKPYAEGWGDNANPTISQEDLNAINNAKKYSNKVIVIMLSGRPLLISDQIQNWDAFVEGWLPGSEGAGIADVIFGDRPFRGKLPIDWPDNLSQLPISTSGKTANNTNPLFERGFSL